MALQSSGAIALSQIQTELGGANPISLSEYYRNGPYTGSSNTSVPTSGAISMSNFYGASGTTVFTTNFTATNDNKGIVTNQILRIDGPASLPAYINRSPIASNQFFTINFYEGAAGEVRSVINYPYLSMSVRLKTEPDSVISGQLTEAMFVAGMTVKLYNTTKGLYARQWLATDAVVDGYTDHPIFHPTNNINQTPNPSWDCGDIVNGNSMSFIVEASV
tara:strand:+ start:1681 stop:2337 length:657 start_codon:yes stop_codon:yes gene_type:complete